MHRFASVREFGNNLMLCDGSVKKTRWVAKEHQEKRTEGAGRLDLHEKE
jgi:hypothetical protein